jgi:esterase/lipase
MESACEGVGIEFVKAEYKDLVRMSTDRKLLVEKRHNYRFSLRMDKVHPFDFVRMTNPLKVYRNELRPLAEVRKRISEGLRHSRTNSKQGFVLVPKEPCGEAVLLIHGLFATANQCRFVAEELRDYGYEVHVPLIAGHGTDVEQLSTIGRAEWYDSIRGAIPHKPFHVVGFSTGGLIAAHIARDYKVLSLSTICAPTSFVQKNIAFTKVLSVLQFPRYVDNHGDSETYNQMPVHTLSELLYFTEETKKVFPEVKVNTLVVQADYDPIVTPSSGQEIHSLIKGSKLIIVESQEHNINNSKDIVIDFIRSNNE